MLGYVSAETAANGAGGRASVGAPSALASCRAAAAASSAASLSSSRTKAVA